MCIKDRVRFILKVYSCNIGVCKAINLWHGYKRRKPCCVYNKASIKKAATYSPTFAVPSALKGLTSLFGMGRGGTPSL